MKRKLSFRLMVGLSMIALAIGGYVVACSNKSETPAKERIRKTRITRQNQMAEATRSTSYEVLSSVPDAGTIRGVVSYAGTQTDGTVTIVKDNEVCEHHKVKVRPEGAILVNDGKLKNVVVYLSDITRGLKAQTSDVTVDNKECTFVPRVQIGFVGGRIVALNSDDTLHNTHLYLADPGNTRDLKNMALPKVGQSRKYKIKYAGLHDVKCDAHNWMQGWVHVSKHPYATVTDANGSFQLENVPAGDWTVKMWHEKFGEQEAKVTVSSGGSASLELQFN